MLKTGSTNKVFELVISLEELERRDLTREGVQEGLRKPLGEATIEQIFNTLQSNSIPDAIKLNTETNTLEDCCRLINNSFSQ